MSVPSRTAQPETLVLIDGHALAYRSYFALPPLSNSGGESTHAIVGFMRQALRLARQKGNQLVVVFDPPGGTFRHEQYEDYKSGRAETPSDLPPQIRRIRELVDALGWPRLEEKGYEADDVIASLTRRAQREGMEVRILTSDRDAYQLLADDVKVIKNDNSLFGPEDVLDKYGVTVEQWVDFRALTGDASDNIPGAKGIGPKTATKILQEYGTLDAALDAAKAGTLQPKGTRQKLLDSEDAVRFSRELSQMVCDLELACELRAGRGAGDPARLNELLEELELDSLRGDIARLVAGELATGDAAPQDSGGEPPAGTLAEFSTPETGEWQAPAPEQAGQATWGYVLSREDDLTAELRGAAWLDGRVARPVPALPETPALFELAAEAAPAAPKKRGKAKEPQPQADETVLTAALAGQELDAAGAKALATWLSVRGGDVTPGDDPLLLAYLLDPANTAMPAVAKRYLDTDWPEDAGTRAAIAAQLLELLPPQLDAARLKLYTEVEKPLSGVLARMEARGVRLDSEYLQGLSLALAERLERLEAQIHEAAGREFSIRSRDQLEAVLYDELGLASGKKTKLTGKRSTAMTALEPLRDEHPIIPLILEYRELEKLRGTYLDPLPRLVNPRTGRLHTTFAQTAVATGRLSSLNPNLQNIPIRSEEGRQIRKGFIADGGFRLVAADYSQLELRLMAHIAGDEPMQRAFQEGADIHRRTAAQVLGLDESTVDVNQRRAAKTVNFGVLYGMSAHRLSNELGIPYAEATSFIENYFGIYPGIQRYIEETLEFGRQHGYVETLYGRRRYVPELKARNRNLREAGERLAYNMPIQGTAADIMKMAMVALEPQLDALGARMLLQVHDELLIEAPADRAEEVAALTRQVMEGVVELNVPLAVEAGISDNWYEAK
ncbi:DNA polymerase I [Deinococcus proteolyticus MRP]|uniref:DNA polymerase I n=1 Tax=Deinococcus proteolyticus (strain ATCC 35074 / DSM 20540 / JCM 6276 / NBRC 101906 / NCIMB 13154 / VKM Ac-1939 / CCM 2703 / MRP) TaxID=693977 RepID=F0RN55_DEIPM|nr:MULTISPECIES: DNA polymerase I [Deinococcus]ADY26197.1 DNA polymerase I [Deinococcus proteolyticus MRP]MCY1702318.1 DNA polymerase I [Deinococcus sp. SL84]